ncbi:flagellar hook-associated protein FlgL [Legionella sp. W05-934-2]|jgi:flagellar hook-associated protein 3 FlgL|uniref:flagellar hook-associated protein FlgL n=1 Tax=Legionella sp. W05-934-2 TaxID=1198649 RepID=UPI003461F62A
MRISTNQIFLRGVNSMQVQQQRLLELQQQVSTGKRVQFPSDDPIAAAQIEQLNKRIDSATRLKDNNESAKGILSFEESILDNSINVIQRLRELQLQASNSALSDEDRKTIAAEARSLQDQLVSLANTQDSDGSYIFSGSRTNVATISRNGAGQFVYGGDELILRQDVTLGLRVALNDTGSDLYMRLPNGNGRFTVTQPGNAGTVVATSGAVTQEASYVEDDYTVSFTTNTAGDMVVLVSGAVSGNIIPPTGLPDDAPLYESGNTISFNGIEIKFTGVPQAGDSFSLQPSVNESVFATIDRMVANLEKSSVNNFDKAAIQTENNQMMEQLDTALDNLLNHQADVGARLNQLDIAEFVNQDLIDTSIEIKTKLEDVDLPSVAVELNLQRIYLQAAQQTFAMIQGLSAFNFL